jgi:hypothetical protein
VKAGYADWKHMASDRDLDSLRKDPRYRRILEELKKKE